MDFGYNRGFDMFSIMSFIFPLFFVLVAGFIVFGIIKSIGQWNRNNHQPVLTVSSKVTGKRTHVSGSSGENSSTSSSYYITFEVESGDRMEFYVSSREYGLIAEGDLGKLTFQGTRFLNFERQREIME